MATTPRRRGRPPKAVELERMHTLVWYRVWERESGVTGATALQRKYFPDNPEMVRTLQRYSHGKHTPRVRTTKAPGIVLTLGLTCRRSLGVHVHPLWPALDPKRKFDTKSADRLLEKLPLEATDHFLIRDSQNRAIGWDWGSLRQPGWPYPTTKWPYPTTNGLIIGFLATYLLLWRVLVHGHHEKLVVDNATTSLRSVLETLPQCRYLNHVATDMQNYIEGTFLRPFETSASPRVV